VLASLVARGVSGRRNRYDGERRWEILGTTRVVCREISLSDVEPYKVGITPGRLFGPAIPLVNANSIGDPILFLYPGLRCLIPAIGSTGVVGLLQRFANVKSQEQAGGDGFIRVHECGTPICRLGFVIA
jgi:hypothetical protein